MGRAYTQITAIQLAGAMAGPSVVDSLIPSKVPHPLVRSGLTPRMQDAMRRAIQDEGGDVYVAVRERPIGAEIADDLGIPSKPMGVKKVDARGAYGTRFGVDIRKVNGVQKWYVSDLDAAWLIKDGKMITDFSPDSGIGKGINDAYNGKHIIMHGDHMTGLWQQIKDVSPDYLIDEVYVFNRHGFVEAGSMHEMFRKFMQIR